MNINFEFEWHKKKMAKAPFIIDSVNAREIVHA